MQTPSRTTVPRSRRVEIDDVPYWLFDDGTRLPVISGGSGESDGDGGDGDGGDGDGEPELGDGGKKALAAERKARKAADRRAREAKKAAEKAAEELEALRSQHQTDFEKELEEAKRQAAEEAAQSERAKWARQILASKIEVAAAGKLTDPPIAIQLLDLDEFEVDGDGNVDTEAIAAAVDDLIEQKPYLKADATSALGTADGGVKNPVGDTAELTAAQRLRRAYEKTK